MIGLGLVADGRWAQMTTLYPVSGAFTHYTSRFVDPALGFALGCESQPPSSFRSR